MSAEAQAAYDALSGYVAYLENAPSERKFWIWDGHVGRYYSEEGMFASISKLVLDEFATRLDYRPCPVPEWFAIRRASGLSHEDY